MQLVSELRQLMPRIATEAEQARVRTNDEWFARQQAHATRELAELICSDVPERALPPVTLSDCIRDWRWCASTLFLDLKPVLGVNATVRCIASVLPVLCGESPALSTVRSYLKETARQIRLRQPIPQDVLPLSGPARASCADEQVANDRA